MNKNKLMNVFWSKNPLPGNFGDILTPVILNHYKYNFKHTSNASPESICVGSIAKFARRNTIVLGSGAMSFSNELNPRAKWIWVRGPYTRELVLKAKGSCPEIYGDPALLLKRIYNPKIEKTNSIGIIPHYVDYEWAIQEYAETDYKVINLLDKNPLKVIDQILSCEKVISSSLHGIIAAHAYGMPAAWVKFSDKLSGDGIKFKDHFSAVNCDTILSTVESPSFLFAEYDDSKIHNILTEGKFLQS